MNMIKLPEKALNIEMLFNKRGMRKLLQETEEWSYLTDMDIMEIYFQKKAICIRTTDIESTTEYGAPMEKYLHYEKGTLISREIFENPVSMVSDCFLTGPLAIEYLVEQSEDLFAESIAYKHSLPSPETEDEKEMMYSIMVSYKRLFRLKNMAVTNGILNIEKDNINRKIDEYYQSIVNRAM